MFGGLGYLNKLGASGGLVFSPRQLFSGGEQGAWYDPSDFPPNWRVNLLTYTEQFDNAAWVKLNTTVGANAVTAPDGTLTADRAINNTTSGRHTLTNTATGAALGITYTASVYVKKETQRYIVFGDAGDSVWRLITFDFDTATITGQTNVTSSSVTSVGDGWFRLVFTATRTFAAGNYDIFVGFTSTSTNSSPPTYVGSTDDKFYVWGAQLQLGSTATAYQQIVTPEISFLQYNPQPVMFQDAAGTTPVTAVEQAVGLICDKRNGTNFSVRYNLFTFSEQFDNAAWTKQQTTVTANSTTAPDGTLTAYKVIPDTNVLNHAVRTDVTTTVQSYAFSVYAKAAEYIWITVYNTTGAWGRTFNLQTGTVGTATVGAATATIQDAGNGWYRCIVVGTATAASNAFRVYVNNGDTIAPAFAGDGTSGLFLWGAQVQTGSSATTYQPTATYPTSWPSGNHAFQTTSASRPTLRARYNLLTFSEQFNDASWAVSNSSISPNATTAPDGTTTADKLVDNAVLAGHFVGQSATTATTTHICSVYVKRAERNWCVVYAAGANVGSYFDLVNGVVGSAFIAAPTSTSIQSVGDGWFRCSITFTATSSTTVRVYTATADGLASYTGDGTSGIFVWGAQLIPNAVFPSNTYQRIAAATDYATGAAFPLYLAFDGTDDSLLTANVDFATVTSDGAARRNLLLNPTQFDAAAWTLSNATVTANSTAAPDSTTTADTLVENTATSIHAITSSSVTYAASSQYALSIYAKPSGRNWILVQFPTVPFGATTRAWFNVSAGTVGTRENCTGTIADAGNGWFRCTMVATTTVGGAGTSAFYTSTGDALSSYTGDGVSGLFLWGAQVELGSTATAFQNIGTDKMTVWSGLSKLSDAAAGILAELSVTIGSNNGSFVVVAPTGAAGNNYQYAARGTVTSSATSAANFASPITNVVTGQSDIGVPTISIRVNTVTTTSALTQGTGNYGNYPLYIGRRGGTSQPFNGRIYSLIVRGAASNTTQVAQTEKWVANKTPLGTV